MDSLAKVVEEVLSGACFCRAAMVSERSEDERGKNLEPIFPRRGKIGVPTRNFRKHFNERIKLSSKSILR